MYICLHSFLAMSTIERYVTIKTDAAPKPETLEDAPKAEEWAPDLQRRRLHWIVAHVYSRMERDGDVDSYLLGQWKTLLDVVANRAHSDASMARHFIRCWVPLTPDHRPRLSSAEAISHAEDLSAIAQYYIAHIPHMRDAE